MISGLALLRHRGERRRNRNLSLALIFLATLPLAAQAPPPAIATAEAQLAAGDTEAAVATYRRALTSLAPRDRVRGEVLDQLSAIETASGDYDAAVRDATAAAAVYDALRDGRARASSLNQAGLAELYAGRYAPAREQFEHALRVAATAGDDEARVEELVNLASVDFYTGRYADASARYDAAERFVAAHSHDAWFPRRRRLILANRATLDQRLGRYDEALAEYRQALDDPTNVRADEHAQMLVNLGVVYRRLGDPDKALAAYDDAMKLLAGAEQFDALLGVLKNRGIVLALDLGRLDEARATFATLYERAAKAGNAREALQAQLYGAESALRLGDVDAATRGFRAASATAQQLATVEEQWKALYGLARSELASHDDASAERELRAAVAVIEKIREAIRVPSLKSDFFNDKREVFDALLALRLRRGASARELFELIERGRSRGWRDRLSLTAAVELPAIQRALPDGALLLEYWTSAFGSAVASVSRTRAEVRAIRIDADAIEKLAAALPRGAGSEWRASATRLAAELLPPLPRDASQLIVVSDGALASVPFELLPQREGLVVERHAVTYLPTAAMLLRNAAPVHRFEAPWTTTFRGFADPIGLQDGQARLTGSAREVRDIAAEVGGRSLLYVGPDDQKAYLANRNAPPLLHIAGHAFVDPAAIEQSRILFSPNDFLYLKEAYDLPLANVELAVLSACDTERGRVLAGEGVESFSRAFLAAGAKSTVTTLWRVPDATTADFMRIFYRHLQRGATRAEALRLAKLRLLRSGTAVSDPHYWAAFVLTGDGLRPVSTALRWRTIAMAIGALLAAAIGVYFVARK